MGQTDTPAGPPPEDLKRRDRRGPALVALSLVIAAALRLAYLQEVHTSPFFDVPLLDSLEYEHRAVEILDGSLLWPRVGIHGPLYPYLMAFAYRVFPDRYTGIRLLQFLLGCGSVLLIYGIGRRLLSGAAAATAAFMAAAYAMTVYFEGEMVPAALVVFLNMLMLLLLLKTEGSRRYGAAALAGLVLGLSAAARPNILLFLPAAAAWLAADRSQGRRRRLAGAAVFTLGALLVVVPVCLQNRRSAGEFIFMQRNMGLNLYLGNHPAASGTPYASPGLEYRRIYRLPGEHGMRSPGERDRFFRLEVTRFALGRPAEFLKLTGRKFLLFWNSREVTTGLDIPFAQQYSRLIRSPALVRFGLVAPLGILGAVLLARSGRKVLLLHLYLVCMMLSVVMTVVSARYRLPAVPAVILFASHAILWWCRQAASRKLMPVALSAILLACLFLAVNHHVRLPRDRNPEEPHIALGMAYSVKGKRARAKGEEALAKREKARAREAYLQALDINPYSVEALISLGLNHLREGETREAIKHLAEASSIRPDYGEAHFLLGRAYSSQGDLGPALAAYTAALERDPAMTDARMSAGLILSMQGKVPQAIAQYELVLKLEPDNADAWYRMGLALTKAGEEEKAAASYRRAAELRPRREAPHKVFEQAMSPDM